MADQIKGFKDTIAWYDANAERYIANIEKVPNDFKQINKFIDAVGKNAKVLDAGCAAGKDCRILKDKKLEPIGIDLSESFIAIARKKHPDIEFINDNFLHLPIENETFAGIWAHASLLHLETIEEVGQVLQEFYRVLKPRGVVHISVKQQPGKEKTAVVSDTLSGHDRFFQWFTKSEIQLLLEKSGFTIQEIQDECQDVAGREDVKWIVALARK